MATIHDADMAIESLFFKPLSDNYRDSTRPFSCTSISDLDFPKLGILRCISHAKTDHQFL